MKLPTILLLLLALATTTPTTARAQAAPPPVKLYQQMSRDEQTVFVAERARHIARELSGTEYQFTPAFTADIRNAVDFYARRVGNNGGDTPGTGDARFVFERGQANAPVLIGVFKGHNLSPLFGLYVPLIESEYLNLEKPNEVGAVGMFQFLPQTGKRYGLTVQELLDVEKSSDAAARYLANNLKQFAGDPMKEALALLAYNRGETATARALQTVLNEQNRRCSICALNAARGQLDETFQKENVYYVPRFFAAAIVGENPRAFGLALQPLSSYEARR